MPEIDSCDIDGVLVSIHELGKGYARNYDCADCGYSSWAQGDRKFVVEHDSYREHICPTCAVNRGVDEEYFEKNANDQRECPRKTEFNTTKCGERRCSSASDTVTYQYTLGDVMTTSLLEAIDKKTGEKIMICPSCWIERAVVKVRRDRNYDGDERPEDMLDLISSACSTAKCKEVGEVDNNDNKKRSLPEDSANIPAKRVA